MTPANGWASLPPTTSGAGPDPDALPDRDFSAGSWQCRSCPFLAICQPGKAAEDGTDETEPEIEEVSDEEAREAVAAYAEAQESHDASLRRPSAARWTP